MKNGALIGIFLLVSACSQADAPADKVEKAATKIVDAAQGSEAPVPVSGIFAPRDECGDLEGAAEFRRSLAAVIEARDLDGLIALAADDIKLDFGGGSGAAELRRRLSTSGSGLWTELDQLLVLGCATNAQGGMTIPWYFEQDLPGDPSTAMLVTGQEIPLLAKEDGKSLAQVSWDMVSLTDGLRPEQPFQQVSYKPTPEEEAKEGFIATPQLRSVIDYRLVASRRNGKWSITSFIAGD